MDLVGIEEAQFFDASLVDVADTLRQSGRHVIASGLNTDFAGRPFGAMPTLLAMADEITMLTAICVVCGETATRTQRLVGGRPAAIDDPLIVIGGFDSPAAVETYEARCLRHHEVAPAGPRAASSPSGCLDRAARPVHRLSTVVPTWWTTSRAPGPKLVDKPVLATPGRADIVRFARRGRWHRRRTGQR